MTFNPIHGYPDPLTGAVGLGLLWGLVAIAVVVRRSTASETFRSQLLIVIAILTIGAGALTIRSLGILVRHAEAMALGGLWFGIAGCVAFAAIVTYRIASRPAGGAR